MRKFTKISFILMALNLAELTYHNYSSRLEADGLILDKRFRWSYDEAKEYMDKLGPERRAAYEKSFVGLSLGGDMFLPFAFAMTTIGLLRENGSIFSFLPVFGALCDYYENVAILYIIRLYPDTKPTDWMYQQGGQIATPGKWVFIATTLILVANALFFSNKNKEKAQKED